MYVIDKHLVADFTFFFLEKGRDVMAKITLSSTRVYYNELNREDALSIKHDIAIYQSMRKKAYKII